MTNDPRLENYLSKLEQVLKPFPVSDRAEIVTEIKSHVLSALERDPQARLDTVLSALGEPETVANRYLLERGLQPTKPPISPVVKWIVIGFLSMLAMILLFAGILFTKFTPLLHIDDQHDRVSVLGGLIQLDGKEGRELVREFFGEGWNKVHADFKGATPLKPEQGIALKFGNGKIQVENAEDSKFSWECRSVEYGATAPGPKVEPKAISLDLSALAWVKCTVFVPKKANFKIDGTNGKIDFDEPHFNLDARLTNGKVTLTPDDQQAYRYDLSLMNGKKDSFESSDKADAYSISVHVNNGKISNER